MGETVKQILADIKRQYEGHDASLAMVDEVLETFVHHQEEDDVEPGSDREREPNSEDAETSTNNMTVSSRSST